MNVDKHGSLASQLRAQEGEAPPGYKILGWDAAGVVEATGHACSLFKPGDEIF
jgi:NADPH:quinone reductase